MSKFAPYESPAAFLARKFVFIAKLRSLYFKYNKFDEDLTYSGQVQHVKRSTYLLGGLNPLFALKKEFFNTFSRYKSKYYIQSDLLQPLRGIGNLIKGVFNIIAAPLIFSVNLGRYVVIAIKQRSFTLFKENIKLGSMKAGGGFLNGISSLISGSMQLISMPFTWLLKMPLRGVITALKGQPTVKQNIQKRVNKLEDLIKGDDKSIKDAMFIDQEMQSIRGKIVKAQARGQKIGVDDEKIAQRFPLCQRFTEKRLKAKGLIRAQLYGVVTSKDYEYCLDDSNYVREKALSFLSLFKAKNTEVKEEPILDEGDEVMRRWGQISSRSYF